MCGTLYLVATPLGNLEDFTPRAQRVLSEVDLVLAEDTRHSRKLLDYFGIQTPMSALHEHNEQEVVSGFVERLQAGDSIAQISDAGMPLISDPGFLLARAAREAEIPVTVIPGASAPICALALSGLPVDRFTFEGFLPSKTEARKKALQALLEEPRTMIFFESPKRIFNTVQAAAEVFGAERLASVVREITKMHETAKTAPLGELVAWMEENPEQRRGEFVFLVEGKKELSDQKIAEAQRIAVLLVKELPPRKAAALAAEITGVRKNELYRFLLEQAGK